jgi:O-glycosyl hydrolase
MLTSRNLHQFAGFDVRAYALVVPMIVLLASLGCGAQAQGELIPGGKSILPPNALLTTPVGGLERTKATAQIATVTGQPFDRALRIVIGQSAAETNATQLTIRNAEPIEKGDALLAWFSVRGTSAVGNKPAQMEFLFEKATDPWTKSVTSGVVTRSGNAWKRVLVPFTAADNYGPGEAMVSLRFAFSPQTLEIGDLAVVNYGKTRTSSELVALAAEKNPLGKVNATVNLNQTRQTMRGFGGNFAQPRYGATEPMDAVGQYNLDNLRVVHARVGIPLNHWVPQPGVYKDESQAQAAFRQMQMMTKRKIPITGSVWEGPLWMLPGTAERTGRTLPRERYDDCIDAIAQFLVTARDKYGATVDYFSFNEPDYGVNFKFTPAQMAEFIRLAGPRFAALGLKTKFLTADTANGSNFVDYARPLLEDKTIAPYLGPLAFHSWDVLGAQEEKYTGIAALGRQYNKPVWCTEAGHDAQLWQAQNAWQSWENALRTALAYERTIRLSGAEQMDYWTYQDNYPLVSKDGKTPFPVWQVLQQMEVALPQGSKIATATTNHDDLKVLPTAGPRNGQFSLLLVNSTGPGEVTLSGLPRGATISVMDSTTASQRQARTQALRTNAQGRVTVILPARSVVTLVSGNANTTAK